MAVGAMMAGRVVALSAVTVAAVVGILPLGALAGLSGLAVVGGAYELWVLRPGGRRHDPLAALAVTR